ncbi:UNVERIFIED_CONTAM: hypothetical protein NCL1_49553 [Trichonephila clavipes]
MITVYLIKNVFSKKNRLLNYLNTNSVNTILITFSVFKYPYKRLICKIKMINYYSSAKGNYSNELYVLKIIDSQRIDFH